MISVAEAQDLCLALVKPLDAEPVALMDAANRVLAVNATTTRAQPPFPSAAMDGYAVKDSEVRIGASFSVVGESAAGHGWDGVLQSGQAVRIFTGAPVPEGADHVVIQEDIARDGDTITIQPNLGDGPNVRPEGVDFPAGFALMAPHLLRPADLALLAAMNVPTVQVTRKPVVAILATGDELVMPGDTPNRDQIIASNLFALKAMVEEAGGIARVLPIAKDTEESLERAFAAMANADIQVTIGGASVGDYDLVGKVAAKVGLDRAFYKIAMRPGKPLIAGQFAGRSAYLGLPGNPVSAIVCGHLFLVPMVRKLTGLTDPLPQPRRAVLAEGVSKNGPRLHYMRARVDGDRITAFDSQDSSLLSVLSSANALLVRPIDDPARTAGEVMEYLPI